jgi:hypothetical protein
MMIIFLVGTVRRALILVAIMVLVYVVALLFARS